MKHKSSLGQLFCLLGEGFCGIVLYVFSVNVGTATPGSCAVLTF